MPNQTVIARINLIAKMGVREHSYVLEKWCHPAKQTLNGDGLVDDGLSEHTNLIIAFTFNRGVMDIITHCDSATFWQGTSSRFQPLCSSAQLESRTFKEKKSKSPALPEDFTLPDMTGLEDKEFRKKSCERVSIKAEAMANKKFNDANSQEVA
ncbi:hypothetical protein RB195_002837 [Necator americanus]|uniref:Uncharacterized protein n=1 Tax=Necator americanus TaxID=51031 RepID=A0ABR1DL36_NECAM